jgi:hypothetical protein
MADAIRGEVARWREGRPAATPNEDVVTRYERRRQAEALADVFGRLLGGAAATAPRRQAV